MSSGKAARKSAEGSVDSSMLGDVCLDKVSSSRLADMAAGRERAKLDWFRGLVFFASDALFGGRPRLFLGGETGLLNLREGAVGSCWTGTSGSGSAPAADGLV
jgi:hypothetical protein